MKSFTQLKKNLKNDFSHLKLIRTAVLGDTATQFLTQAIRGCGYDAGLDLQMWETDFNQIELQVSDPNSELYEFKPEVIIIFQSAHKLLGKYNKLKGDKHSALSANEMEYLHRIVDALSGNTNAKIIYYNYTKIDDSVFGNFSLKTEMSFLSQLRKLNYELMVFAAQTSNFYLCDIKTIQNHMGKPTFFQSTVYINTEMVLSIDSLPYVASKTVDIIGALNGKFKKCEILDLDNTTWAGIIGDDGIENIQIGSLGIGNHLNEHGARKITVFLLNHVLKGNTANAPY